MKVARIGVQDIIVAVTTFGIGLIIYTDIPIPLAGYYLPSAFGVAAISCLSPFLFRHLKMPSILLIGTMAFIGAISVFLSDTRTPTNSFRSLIQFLFAVASFVGISEWFTAKRPKTGVYLGALSLAILLSLGSVIEKHVPAVRNASDSFRAKAYQLGDKGMGFSIYENDQRDETGYGGVRSCFFSPEPSIIATTVLAISGSLVFMSSRLPTVALAIFANAAAFYGTRSPLCLIGMVFVVVCLAFVRPKLAVWSLPLFVAIGSVGAVLIDFDQILERIGSMKGPNPEPSIYSRIYLPYAVALPATLAYSPVTGVGFGAKDVASMIVPSESRTDNPEFTIGTNGFVRVFIYLGIGLGLVFYIAVFLYSQKVAKAGAIALISFFFIGHAIGSMEGLRFWIFLALLVSTASLNETNKEPRLAKDLRE